jgi:hypothetical protein
MEMLLMGLCMSAFGVAVAALSFRAATRPEDPSESAQPALAAKPAVPARFFGDRVLPIIPSPPPQVPIEILLRQIENHVRLEQAAAESFVEFPSEALLYCKTTSPLVN